VGSVLCSAQCHVVSLAAHLAPCYPQLSAVESRWGTHPTAVPTTHQPALPPLPPAAPLLPRPPLRSYVLTQFQSHTLNSHIAASYPPMKFGAPDQQAWVDVLAAQQTVTERQW